MGLVVYYSLPSVLALRESCYHLPTSELLLSMSFGTDSRLGYLPSILPPKQEILLRIYKFQSADYTSHHLLHIELIHPYRFIYQSHHVLYPLLHSYLPRCRRRSRGSPRPVSTTSTFFSPYIRTYI